MQPNKLVALPSRISRGAFSKERVFEVALPEGEPHVGTAYFGYFWNDRGQSLSLDEPAPGQTIEGRVAAHIVADRAEQLLVSVPDGEVILVNRSQLVDRPPPSEPARHVFV